MDANSWNRWCGSVTTRLTNLEKTLNTIDRIQKRMLYIIGIGVVAVLINVLLLFYN